MAGEILTMLQHLQLIFLFLGRGELYSYPLPQRSVGFCHQMASSGAVCGLVRNYKKTSPSLVPLIVFTSISPATEIHAIADILSPLTRRE